MWSKLMDMLFGCTHKHYSFPITTRQGQRRSGAGMHTGTYVVCLDCGKEFPYDWSEMRIISPSSTAPTPLPVESYAPKYRAS